MKKTRFFALLLTILFFSNPLLAHFGMIVPSSPTVMETKEANLTIEVKFWHPFENKGLNLTKPKSFSLYHDGRFKDLLPSLKEEGQKALTTWSLPFKVEKPGLYTFLMEPEPYWEPEEDCFIIHYTKVYVDAFGGDEGWNLPTPELKTEIVPLVKPGALYAGNVFTGRVLLNGQAVSGCEVEAEWYPGPELVGQAPYESMVTQALITDENGLFHFAAPRAGWWGLAALNTADYKLKQNNEDKDVELGAVLWLYFHEFLAAVPLK